MADSLVATTGSAVIKEALALAEPGAPEVWIRTDARPRRPDPRRGNRAVRLPDFVMAKPLFCSSVSSADRSSSAVIARGEEIVSWPATSADMT